MQIRYPLFFYLFCTVSTISAWMSNCISILFVSQKPHLPVILLHMKRSIMRSLSVIALLLWVRNFHFPLMLAAVAAVSFTVISYHSLNASTSVEGSWRRFSIASRVAHWLNGYEKPEFLFTMFSYSTYKKEGSITVLEMTVYSSSQSPSKIIWIRILHVKSRTRRSTCACILSENN